MLYFRVGTVALLAYVVVCIQLHALVVCLEDNALGFNEYTQEK